LGTLLADTPTKIPKGTDIEKLAGTEAVNVKLITTLSATTNKFIERKL
jgi:hypothetical protein